MIQKSSELKEALAEEGIIKEDLISSMAVNVEPWGFLSSSERSRLKSVLTKSYKEILNESLVRQMLLGKKHLIAHAVELAYTDKDVLIALLKKLVADKDDVSVNFNLSKEDRDLIIGRLKKSITPEKVTIDMRGVQDAVEA